MKHLTIILLLFLIASKSSKAQNFIKGYTTIPNPTYDKNIIGKKYQNYEPTGDGVVAFDTIKGLDTYTFARDRNAGLKLEAEIKNAVKAKFGLNYLSNDSIELSHLITYKAKRFTDLNDLYEGNSYVTSAIMVKELTIKSRSTIDPILQAKIDSAVTKGNANISADIGYHQNKVEFKKGFGLFVAVQLLKITKTKQIALQTPSPKKDTLLIDNDNNMGTLFDDSPKGSMEIQFMDMNPMDLSTPEIVKNESGHLGCFYVNIQSLSVGRNPNNNVRNSKLIVCPRFQSIKGSEKPSEALYEPTNDWYPGLSRPIYSLNLDDKTIVIYYFQITSLEPTYTPKSSTAHGNFKLKHVRAKVVVKKIKHTYKVSK